MGERDKGDKEQEAGYVLRHDLFDLWFHVAVHRFGFKTNKHRMTEGSGARRSQHLFIIEARQRRC